MGLTIHFDFRLSSRSVTKARDFVSELQRRAKTLPFKEVGEVQEITGDACDFNSCTDDEPHRWLLIQSASTVTRGRHWHHVAPKHIIAFNTRPGDGCEPSNFGLCLYPTTIEIEDRETWPYRKRIIRTGLIGWRWGSFCKTQYASDPSCGGVENFLRCHLLVIRMLDHSKELGVDTNVRDEGDYFEKRNVEALANKVGQWNQMIAAFAGQLKDAIGDSLMGPIFHNPDFENLEAKGREIA